MHLKPTAGCQISTLIFDFFYGGGSLLISHENYIKDGKVLDHLGFKSKVLPVSLNDLSAWVGFCTSNPQQGFLFCGGEGVSINISRKIYQGLQSSCPLGVSINDIAQVFN